MFEDIRNDLRNKTFRLMGYSKLEKKMVMYINCDFVASSQVNRSYEKDELPYTIRYEEEIYGEFLAESNFYGSGIYGDKVYGTNIITEVIG